jgi:hypothetical protein
LSEGVSAMNFSELKRELVAVVQDASPEMLVSMPDLLNESVQQIAEEIKFPELKQITSVATSTSTYYVNMTSTFSSRLKYAGNSTGEYVILDTLEELIQLYPGLAESGSDVDYVVLEGSILYYQPIPTTSVSITCIGYHVPDTLVNDADTPSFIPDYLHREAIVNKAAALAYNIIEDGADGDKVNTKVFTGLAEIGLNKLRAYVSRRRKVTSSSMWSY